ncbi:MAG: GDP-mannose 4,6-dehydratase [Candidatus Latescibacterota bacterium]
MKRVLVTGCWGFVGRVAVEMLHAKGYQVWGTDIMDGGAVFPGDAYLPCDLQDEQAVNVLLDEVHPDCIIHLAAQSSARVSFDEPLPTIRNNVLPVLYILDCLRSRSLKTRLLAVGSADEYGPVPEKAMPLIETRAANPVNPYALSKVMQSDSCRSYASLYGVDVVITRSFNHTGPRQTDTFVLPSFARQVAEIEAGMRPPVLEVGNLEVRRDFLDVTDVVAAYIALLEKGQKGEIYNVCSGVAHSLQDLLDQLILIAGVHVEVRISDQRLRPVDTPELRGDHGKLTRDTAWQPRISMHDMLSSLLAYWRGMIRKAN